MRPTLEQLLLRSVADSNILPVTSTCNVRCIFCSNPQNPPGVETFHMPPLEMKDLRQLLNFVDPKRKIVIGESVTRINEGEPLTHPHFQRIIREIRERFPETPIQLTTNGITLTEGLAKLFAETGGIELNISINTSRPESRRLLMGTRQGLHIREQMTLLRQYEIPFNGSLVAMPHLVGWDDIQETILHLAEAGATSTRVFLPGYTKWTKAVPIFEESMWQEAHSFIIETRNRVNMPISCEPPVLQDLAAVVEGVFPGSPADRVGLKLGDNILAVEGSPVLSRVDAFNRIKEAGGGVQLLVVRRNKELVLRINKEPGESPGVLMSYDLDPGLLSHLISRAERQGYKRVMLLTSELGETPIRLGLKKIEHGPEFTTVKVPNAFFGGTIWSAGLLVMDDFIGVLKKENRLQEKYDAVFIPQVALDPWGRDLCGVHYLDLASALPIPLEVI